MNKRSKTVNSIHAISDCRAQIRMKPRQLTENSNNQVKKKKKKSHTSNWDLNRSKIHCLAKNFKRDHHRSERNHAINNKIQQTSTKKMSELTWDLSWNPRKLLQPKRNGVSLIENREWETELWAVREVFEF